MARPCVKKYMYRLWLSLHRTPLIISACLIGGCIQGIPKDPAVQIDPVTYADIPGWQIDHGIPEALAAFVISCDKILERTDDLDAPLAESAPYAGSVGAWHAPCQSASELYQTAPSPSETRIWFEQHFVPYALTNRGIETGLFTGYYEPGLPVSLTPDDAYTVPVYTRPSDLVMVDLGQFRSDLKGRRIAGRVKDGHLHPFDSRADIIKDGLPDVPVLAYAKDPVDVFFLQIQGSGRGMLPDGSSMRLGYDGQNGHPYYAIGRTLIERNILTRDTVSLQTIRDWLKANPDQADAIMNQNASFVFFRELTGASPLGAANVPLTPERSVALDRKFHALGIPVWVSTKIMQQDGRLTEWNRLMVAQDTGGAIRGPVRGDLFWGTGARAEFIAGHMKQKGRLFVLLPHTQSF